MIRPYPSRKGSGRVLRSKIPEISGRFHLPTHKGYHGELRAVIEEHSWMASRARRPLFLSLIGCGIALLMACNADTPQDAAPSDTPSVTATAAKPAAPAPNATTIALSATATPATGAIAATLTPVPQDAANPVDTVTLSLTTSTPGTSPVSPTTEPAQSGPSPTQTAGLTVTNTPAPTAIPTSPPAATSTPAPPNGPGSPDADVGRATQFVPLDQPRFVPASSAQSMTSESLVLGLDWRGEARAYPLSMMWFHHIANDNIDGWPVLVTY